jgi:hypothetical protein
LHPLKDGPWIFQQRDLETEKTKMAVKNIKQRRRRGGLQDDKSASLFKSST